jgi:sugar phosphate isomerase/epimerase
MWPGLVGKGSPGAEPGIDLDTMLQLTADAQVDGIRFDGIDLFLFDPHTSIDIDDEGIKRLAEKIQSHNFVVGSVVAPVWPPTGGGSAMGSDEERKRFLQQVRKACRIAQKLRALGARPYGVVRIDSASGVSDWAKDPETNQRKIAQTFSEACDIAEGMGERLAAEGEICWGGMHGWKKMVDLLERVNRPKTLGFQADMAHTLLYILGYNAPEDTLLPSDWDWSDPHRLDEAMKTLTQALRPWTIDFHVAQNDATVKGSGTHDKTGHHCLPDDPNGKLSIAHHAGYWLHGADGKLTKAFRHICWDGCMFPNAVMMQPETWNHILAAMIAVRDAHGWREDDEDDQEESSPAKLIRRAKAAPRKKVKRASAKRGKRLARKPARKSTKRLKTKTTMKKKPSKSKGKKSSKSKKSSRRK